MSNEELFYEMEKEFSKEQMRLFSIMYAKMAHILIKEFKQQHPKNPCEYEYDKSWWLAKYKEISKSEYK